MHFRQKGTQNQGLSEYRQKRNFDRTSEPDGTAAAGDRRLFVVQKHAASRLHYDFRLELDGVLLSWAVPKGPSLDPSQKRLAVQVEDHPLDYGTFEGTIPAGEYGGGTVMLWDRGEWAPRGDPRKGMQKGSLKFALKGEKLTGSWSLFRIEHNEKGQDNWLLVKQEDEFAIHPGSADIVATAPASVASGRSMDQISAGEEPAEKPMQKPPPAPPDPSRLQDARKKALPETFRPQLATLVKSAPEGSDWLHEIKLDGYRLMAFVKENSVRLVTRNGKNWTKRFPELAEALSRSELPVVLLDGEVVVLRKDGSSHFQALQNAIRNDEMAGLKYFVFDILYCDGYDLTEVVLAERKAFLRELLEASGITGMIRFSDHQAGKGDRFSREACRAGLEGIVSKLADSPYRQARSRNWLKIKCMKRQEFVIAGFTDPGGSRSGFGALLLGYHDESGNLRYCGRVGTGFNEQALQELLEKMLPLERKTNPFADSLNGSEIQGVHWLTPRLVAEVEFTEWTEDGRLRHPSFQGLREDKEVKEVTREDLENTGNEEPRQVKKQEDSNSIAGVSLSNPERILYPEQGITKRALAEYYEKVGERILPHLAGRPLMVARCPRGHRKKCFYQKHVNESLPETIREVLIQEKEEKRRYIVVDDLNGLISLVQLGALEFHPWGCRADKVEKPDRMIFDLDPDEGMSWKRIKNAARELRELLEDELDLRCFLRTSGGKGLHLVVPLVRTSGWDELKSFAAEVARTLASRSPDQYVTTMSKSKRKGRIFIDYFRNSRGATAICTYSTRARRGAPVAVPLRWEELSALQSADTYTVENIFRRLTALQADPWEGFFEVRQSISEERTKTLKQLGRQEPMAKDHGSQIKDDEQYEKLREQGMSKEKAARIANTSRKEAGKRGGKSPQYEDWSKDDLYQKAKEVGIEGRSKMNKQELIDALRNH